MRESLRLFLICSFFLTTIRWGFRTKKELTLDWHIQNRYSGRHDDGPLSCQPAPQSPDRQLPRLQVRWRGHSGVRNARRGFAAHCALALFGRRSARRWKMFATKKSRKLRPTSLPPPAQARTRRLNHLPPNEKRPQIMLWNTAALMMGQGIGRGTPELFVS